MKTKLLTLIAACALLAGCTTVATTGPDGKVTTTRKIDWTGISNGIKLVVPPLVPIIVDALATKPVLTTNAPPVAP